MDKDYYGKIADPCPKCGAMSYTGGYCFGCGGYRPSKRAKTDDSESVDTFDFIARSFGTRVSGIEETEEMVNEKLAKRAQRERHRPKAKPSVIITQENIDEAALLVQTVIEPYDKTNEGELVRALEIPWRAIVERLQRDWKDAYRIPPRVWEELIAAAFEQDGYDEVTLTPRSGDHGRDVIAIKRGIGCIRIIDSVKAFAPHRVVGHDDVRALAGVLLGDQQASKGIVSATTDFAPGIITDPYLKPLIPYRLELMNGTALRDWLGRIAQKP